MNIITHALMGWCAGQRLYRGLPEVTVIAVASVIPDIDALGAVIDVFRGGEAEFFSNYHHKFGHCLPFCLLLMLVVHLYRKNTRLTLWVALLFHLHLLCDVVGARGPDGYQWPIYYLFPFSEYGLIWSHQWEINAWPNIVLTLWLLYLFFKQSMQMGFSPLALLSSSADEKFVQTLRRRFMVNQEKEQ